MGRLNQARIRDVGAGAWAEGSAVDGGRNICRRLGVNHPQAGFAACLRRRTIGESAPMPLTSSHAAAGSGTGVAANAL
jgi:hypothetical protein